MVKTARLQVKVEGVVQGVGFRPFIYRLAQEKALAGWVRNDSSGVFIEVEGNPDSLNCFLAEITLQKPPLAKVEKVTSEEIAVIGESGFVIKESEANASRQTLISPDMCICDDCLAEMFTEGDRRYRYPFINCTNCGPRYTIINDIPYDRLNTTMAEFTMCPQCLKEYKNPADRRFHAEPNACPECGPKVYLLDNQGSPLLGEPVAEAVKLLKAGCILAIKGLGGYHLACDASSEEAVAKLRARKHREEKPFAIMSRDLQEIRKFCEVSPAEEDLLKDSRRPIVLLKKISSLLIADGVAPKNDTFGVMLPYTPLHYLLLESLSPGLVMTSGNHSSEPITYLDKDALEKLKDKADYFLTHDRKIYQPCDDSVSRVFQDREMMIRRSRGYTPGPVKLPKPVGEILACGAELKNTICVTKGEHAFLSQHIGDLKNSESLQAFEEGIEHLKRIFDVNPIIVAHDLHPDYLSTRYALKQEKVLLCGVQHHHAHIASCMAENGVTGTAIGLSFDGTGYGNDGTLWGGEFLLCGYDDFERLGHLSYVPMVSGEQAIKEPWRMAAVYMKLLYGNDFTHKSIPFNEFFNHKTWELLQLSMDKGINAPLTSSMGRLFDAVSALLGICPQVNFEGQAAVELEQVAEASTKGSYQYNINKKDTVLTVDTTPIIHDIVEELESGTDIAHIAGRFHNTIADLSLQMCKIIRERRGINEVALSGGVFQNITLTNKINRLLKEANFIVYNHRLVPPNDGGISLGQAIIASERGKTHVLSGTGKNN